MKKQRGKYDKRTGKTFKMDNEVERKENMFLRRQENREQINKKNEVPKGETKRKTMTNGH